MHEWPRATKKKVFQRVVHDMPVGATVQPAALPEISAGPADPAATERYRWNRCIQVRQLDAAVNWGIGCSCVSNSSNAAASPTTQICKSFQTICF